MKHLPLFGSISQMQEFLNTNKELGVKFEVPSKRDRYELIKRTTWAVKYARLDRGGKHVVIQFLKFVTGYGKAQIKRLLAKALSGRLAYNPTRNKNKFARKFFPSDIALLIKTDLAHGCLSGEATKKVLIREYAAYKKIEYATISTISVAHIYNIRNHNQQYNTSEAKFFTRTKAASVDIGTRRKPDPRGRPGYLRVDTVHQGDMAENKGVYHINLVDETTQFELIATVPRITERYLKPVVEELLKQFPFVIYEFHSDNGSEYINKVVAELLNKLHVELTKSRSRHTNDNALVESKNGSVIRKLYGRNFIAKRWSEAVNKFNHQYLNVYLNYHRPCGFAALIPDAKGKLRKRYKNWMTPYEKLKSLPQAEQYLKPGITFKALDRIAEEDSDNDFAEKMQKALKKLFGLIAKNNRP